MGIDAGSVKVNGADIYYERRGDGPPLLLIPGATGDGGHYWQVADELGRSHTVITYDRRGNSRSPQPAGWTTTSVEEQADDAAWLLDALGFTRAAVFGSSGGAIIALGLLIRHPGRVTAAMLHEPPLVAGIEDAESFMGTIQALVEKGMTMGGPPAAVEQFVRFAAGDANFESLPAELRARLTGNGETLFGVEMGAFETYRPDDASLGAIEVPVQVLIGEDGAPPFHQAAAWLAERLGLRPTAMAGGHTPYFDHPSELISTVEAFLGAP